LLLEKISRQPIHCAEPHMPSELQMTSYDSRGNDGASNSPKPNPRDNVRELLRDQGLVVAQNWFGWFCRNQMPERKGATLEKDNTGSRSNVIRIGGERIQDHLGEIVRGSVEDALDARPGAGAERLVGRVVASIPVSLA